MSKPRQKPKKTDLKQFDTDNDGVISEKEAEVIEKVTQAQNNERRLAAQRRMAWAALIAIVVFTIAMLTPVVSDDRVKALGDLVGWFYISLAGIVGSFMGMTAWIASNGLGQRAR